MFINLKKLSSLVENPVFSTKHSACMDLKFCWPENIEKKYMIYDSDGNESFVKSNNGKIIIESHQRVMIPTALIFELPVGHHIKIYSRSSMALKKGLILVNSVGIIDEDFDQEVKVLLMNIGSTIQFLTPGDKIAQIEICKTQVSEVYWNNQVTEKGNFRVGGFGSTGN